jgi:hypothetical protein
VSSIINISPETLRDHHRLSARQVNTLFGTPVLPEVIEERIREFEIVGEFLSIYDLLSAGNIRFIPLKGPVLSYRLYGDTTIRKYNDMDILVDAENIIRTKALLEENGYRIDCIAWPEKKALQNKLTRHINNISLINNEKGFVVEIHWRILRISPVSISDLDDLVNQNLTTLNLAGRSFTILNNELELLYLIIHGGLHFWMRLKWLLDVDTFIKTQKIDWERFEKLMNDLKAHRIVALCREIYNEYFADGAKIPSVFAVPHCIVDYSRKLINDEKDTDVGKFKWVFQNFFFTLIAFRGIRYKFRGIAGFLFMSIYSGRIRSVLQLPLKILKPEQKESTSGSKTLH